MDSVTAILVAKEPLRVRQAVTCNLYGQIPRARNLFRMERLDNHLTCRLNLAIRKTL